MEPPREEGTKFYKNDFGKITKMAAMPIYSRESRVLCSRNLVCSICDSIPIYKLYINDDPELTLTYFMARSNKVVYVFA